MVEKDYSDDFDKGDDLTPFFQSVYSQRHCYAFR